MRFARDQLDDEKMLAVLELRYLSADTNKNGQRRYVAMVDGSTTSPSTPAPTAQTRVAQNGTFKARTTMNVKSAPSTSSSVVATYSAGQTFTYDSYVDAGVSLRYLM